MIYNYQSKVQVIVLRCITYVNREKHRSEDLRSAYRFDSQVLTSNDEHRRLRASVKSVRCKEEIAL